MIQISVDEIKCDLPAFLQRAETGATLVLIKSGKPVAETKPILAKPLSMPLRPFGLCAGEFTVPDDFNAPLPENVLAEFDLELLSLSANPEFMEIIATSRKELRSGKKLSLDEMEREFQTVD